MVGIAISGTLWAWMTAPSTIQSCGPRVWAKYENEPVHGRAGRHPHKHAPAHPGPTTKEIERKRDRNLMQHPGALQESVETVVCDAGTGIEPRCTRQSEAEVQVVETVQQQRLVMAQEPVAVGLALRPITAVV
jgi:hypothetical protein